MGKKQVSVSLSPIGGSFRKFSATVDGVQAVKTHGTAATGTVSSGRTTVQIEVEGDPGSEFHCFILAEFETGSTSIVCDASLELDDTGAYARAYAVTAPVATLE